MIHKGKYKEICIFEKREHPFKKSVENTKGESKRKKFSSIKKRYFIISLTDIRILLLKFCGLESEFESFC